MSDFTVLFLFLLGVTKGQWGTLVNALLHFKDDYDANTPLTQALPALVAAHPARYGAFGLRDLADEMLAQVLRSRQLQLQAQAFDRRFPGFEHETHGVEKRDGAYVLYCLTRPGRSLPHPINSLLSGSLGAKPPE